MKKSQFNTLIPTEQIQAAKRYAAASNTTLSHLIRNYVQQLAAKWLMHDIVTKERFQCRVCDKSVYAIEERCIECGNYVIPNHGE
jgi:hypothetical protein